MILNRALILNRAPSDIYFECGWAGGGGGVISNLRVGPRVRRVLINTALTMVGQMTGLKAGHAVFIGPFQVKEHAVYLAVMQGFLKVWNYQMSHLS